MPSQWNNPVRNPQPKSPHVANDPKKPNASPTPQNPGRHPVASCGEGNNQSEPPCIPNRPQRQNAPANPQNLAAHPTTKTQKGVLGKGRPSAKFQYSENYPEANGPKKTPRNRHPKPRNSQGNLGTRQARNRPKKNNGKNGARFTNRQKNPKGAYAPFNSQNGRAHGVDSLPKETFPKPQPEFLKLLGSKGLQISVFPKIFRTLNPSPTAVRKAVYLLRQVYQVRPARSRRYSTGELPVRDKLANTFVMGIPNHRFGISKGKNSIASGPPVLTAEYCGDPYRTAIKERLAAGKPRAPPRSEFMHNSRIYHAAEEDAGNILKLQKGEEPGLMKQVMSMITGMGYARVAKLRKKMRDRWIGYDEFDSYHGHRHAVEYDELQMKRFFKAAMPPTEDHPQLETLPKKPSPKRQKGRGRGRVSGGCRGGHVQKPWQKPRNDRLFENIEGTSWVLSTIAVVAEIRVSAMVEALGC